MTNLPALQKQESQQHRSWEIENPVTCEDTELSAKWLFVSLPGEQNPADLPSRGVNLSQLIDSTLWMTRTTWISDPEFEPQCPDLHPVPDEWLIETRVKNHPALSSLLTHDTCQGEAILNCIQFSTLGRLLRVTCSRDLEFEGTNAMVDLSRGECDI